MVELYVGPEKKLSRAHRSILCDKVPFFQKMFSSNFVEGFELKAYFPEDSPQTFDLLLDWVYSGTLRLFADQKACLNEWETISFYLLMDKLRLPGLMDQTMDVFSNLLIKQKLLPRFPSVELVYENSTALLPLRRFLAQCAYYIVAGLRQDNAKEIWPTVSLMEIMSAHEDFAVDFFDLMRSHTPCTMPQDPRNFPKCRFHCHEYNEPCTQI